MSLWGVHIGIAGSLTTLLLFAFAPGFRYRGVVIAASSLWAVVVDFHHALDAFPALQAGWAAVHRSAFADLFWFHRLIDRADPRDRVAYSLVMWGVLFVVIAGTELAIRRRRSRDGEADHFLP